VIVLALVCANLPFLNQRFFALIPLKKSSDSGYRKSLWLRVAELLISYFLLGALAFFMESLIGNSSPQDWQFYAVSACLFIVFSFPGFVYCYLYRS